MYLGDDVELLFDASYYLDHGGGSIPHEEDVVMKTNLVSGFIVIEVQPLCSLPSSFFRESSFSQDDNMWLVCTDQVTNIS